MNKLGTKGLLYKAISPSGKVYIGITTSTLQKRIKQHFYFARSGKAKNHKFANALLKYGDKILWEIITKDVPLKKLCEMEVEFIDIFDSYNSGYNSTTGGEESFGRILSDATKRKISKSHKGKFLLAKTKQKISEANTGKIVSEETRLKISKNNIRYWASHKQTQSMRTKNSQSKRGSKNWNSKLTWDDIRYIREKYTNDNKYSSQDIAREFNISKTNALYIVNNNSWVDKNYVVPDKNEKRKPSDKENNGNKKLNKESVCNIRELYSTGNYSYIKLAKRFGVGKTTISHIIKNRSWRE